MAETTGDTTATIMGSNEFNSTNAIGVAFTISVNVTATVYTNIARYYLYCGQVPVFFPNSQSSWFLNNFTELRMSGFLPIAGSQGGTWYDHSNEINVKYINCLGYAGGFGLPVDSINSIIPTNTFQMNVKGMTFSGGYARTDVIYHR